jgi:hypothetical protein
VRKFTVMLLLLASTAGAKDILWRDPGRVEDRDLRRGPAGPENAPRAPFRFVDEDTSGTSPKLKLKDADGREYVAKFGHEAKPDTFGSRLAWALGYTAEPNYYVPDGIVIFSHDVQRTSGAVNGDGVFHDGRFQLRAKYPVFVKDSNWRWDQNPFIGTPELAGLKILMMLLSNWDDKDERDAVKRGANTAMFQAGGERRYFIDDWGGAMGSWGNYFTRSKWNPGDFQSQSADFVRRNGDEIEWGYRGQHSELMKERIRISDVRWLMQYLGRISDQQLRDGLLASGANAAEADVFTSALRTRIEALRKIAGDGVPEPTATGAIPYARRTLVDSTRRN